ncbi:lipopolysaccharide kinase InaA family protein [Vreelandella sp. TE19]
MKKKLQRFIFPERPSWYLVRDTQNARLLSLGELQPMPQLDAQSSSRFYAQPQSSTLFKLVGDKYSPRQNFWRWLGRDILSKRLAGSYDAHKEFKSRRVLKKLGQRTVDVRCYGVALNFLNPLGSLYAMEYMNNCTPGSAYFEAQDEQGRHAFIESLGQQVAQLAQAGYYHRDLHIDNLLVDSEHHLIWIDTHIKALPSSASKRAKLLEHMLDHNRIEGAAYRAELSARLAPYFQGAL